MNLAFTAFIKSKGYTTKGALADACGMDRTVFCDRCRGPLSLALERSLQGLFRARHLP